MLEHLTLIGVIIVACAGFAATVGGLAAAVGAYREQRQLAMKSDEIARLAMENAALSQTIAAKSDEIARLAKDNLASVTGGDSFVYLEPLRRFGRVRYFVRQSGAHPTFDVVVRVQDGTGQRDLFGPTTIGTIKRGSGMDWTSPLPPWPLAPDRQLREVGWPTAYSMPWPLAFQEPAPAVGASLEFSVQLAARNGIIVQKVKVWPRGDRWYTASRNIERAGVALTLPGDFNEAQDQDADGNRIARAPLPGAK